MLTCVRAQRAALSSQHSTRMDTHVTHAQWPPCVELHLPPTTQYVPGRGSPSPHTSGVVRPSGRRDRSIRPTKGHMRYLSVSMGILHQVSYDFLEITGLRSHSLHQELATASEMKVMTTRNRTLFQCFVSTGTPSVAATGSYVLTAEPSMRNCWKEKQGFHG